MGNRAVITTEENYGESSGLGVYLHWNGGRDSVQGFLEYCRLRSFRAPENDDYGWARLCQIAANFLGADGTSIGIDDITRLDMDNGDNGVYLIRDWKIVGRRHFDGEEQSSYDLNEFLHALDRCQPDHQQLGDRMIDCLLYHNSVISDVSWNYQYEISKRADEGKDVGGFQIGRFYSFGDRDPKSIFRLVDKSDAELIFKIDGEKIALPRFIWKDGSESTLLMNESGRRVVFDSSKEVIA